MRFDVKECFEGITLTTCMLVTLGLLPTRLHGAPGPQAGQKPAAGPPSVQSGLPGSRPQPKSVVGDDYVVGAGDLLLITVWKEPDLTRSLPVRPDGKISLPLIGEIDVNGLTSVKLGQVIAEKLKAYLDNPEVNVTVQEVRSHLINIVGEVAKPGTYALTRPATVLDAIALAGGLQEFAKARKIYVLRSMPNGTQQRFPFDYKAVIKGQKMNQNIELKSGDTLVIP